MMTVRIFLALLPVALAILPLAAAERMFVYGSANISSGLTADKCTKLQNGVFENADCASSGFSLDLKYPLHLTKLVYAGRPMTASSVSKRMRNAAFKGSLDGSAYTTFYTVPSDYDIDQSNPVMTEVALSDVTVRYVSVSGIQDGSSSEIQFWTDTDLIVAGDLAFSGESSAGANYSLTARVDGDFAADAPMTLTLYVATSDLGSDLADWQAGATAVSCGTVAGSGTWSGFVAKVVDGDNYVRALVTADTVGGETISSFSSSAVIFTALAIAENRPSTDTSACRLTRYPDSGDAYLAFDGNDSTYATVVTGGIDYGRPVRIDRVTILTTGANACSRYAQVSQDGWTWQSIAKRETTDPLKAVKALDVPVVARYLRYGDNGAFQTTPQIAEIRTFASDGAAFVSPQNETAVRTGAGLSVSGTLYADNLAADAPITLRGYVAASDFGINPTDWATNAATTVIELGTYKSGDAFTTAPLPGVRGELRYGCVAAYADGAAAAVGTVFPFTGRDEAFIDVTKAMVLAAGGTENKWKQCYYGNRNVIHLDDSAGNAKAVLSSSRRFQITMVEWHERVAYQCQGRVASATFKLYKTPGDLSTCEQIAKASDAVGAYTGSVRGNRWMPLAVSGNQKGYAIGVADAQNGSGFFRFYGRQLGGLVLVVK